MDIVDAQIVAEKGEISETPIDELQFLHLKNATYWVNGTKVPSSQTSMVVNIDSINAFNLGVLQSN